MTFTNASSSGADKIRWHVTNSTILVSDDQDLLLYRTGTVCVELRHDCSVVLRSCRSKCIPENVLIVPWHYSYISKDRSFAFEIWNNPSWCQKLYPGYAQKQHIFQSGPSNQNQILSWQTYNMYILSSVALIFIVILPVPVYTADISQQYMCRCLVDTRLLLYLILSRWQVIFHQIFL